jgi:hypothetical protein
VHAEWPRGTLPLEDSTAIRHLRGTYEFRQLNDDEVLLCCSEPGTAWTVIYEDTPTFTPSCLNRTIRVHPVDDMTDVAVRLEPYGLICRRLGVALSPPRVKHWQKCWGLWGDARQYPRPYAMAAPEPGITMVAVTSLTWYVGPTLRVPLMAEVTMRQQSVVVTGSAISVERLSKRFDGSAPACGRCTRSPSWSRRVNLWRWWAKVAVEKPPYCAYRWAGHSYDRACVAG